jgi:hypothetical protein
MLAVLQQRHPKSQSMPGEEGGEEITNDKEFVISSESIAGEN